MVNEGPWTWFRPRRYLPVPMRMICAAAAPPAWILAGKTSVLTSAPSQPWVENGSPEFEASQRRILRRARPWSYRTTRSWAERRRNSDRDVRPPALPQPMGCNFRAGSPSCRYNGLNRQARRTRGPCARRLSVKRTPYTDDRPRAGETKGVRPWKATTSQGRTGRKDVAFAVGLGPLARSGAWELHSSGWRAH